MPNPSFFASSATLAGGETVNPAPLTITASPNSKIYDATVSAAAVPVVSGLLGSDTVTGLTEVYSDAGVGSSKTLSVSAYTVQDGNGGKNYTVSTVANGSGIISPRPSDKFIVSIMGATTNTAGNSFLVTVQATDQNGNPLPNNAGPASATIAAAPPDPMSNLPLSVPLNGSGFGFFMGTLYKAGTYTITATAGSVTGSSATLVVLPASAINFTVTAPPTALTGTPFNINVKAFDAYGNLATGYGGQVHFTSTDLAAALPGDGTLAGGMGSLSATLKTAGNQTITATDTKSTAPLIAGSSASVTTRGLTVTSFTPTADGFTVAFAKPFIPGDLRFFGPNLTTVPDVTIFGNNGVGAIHGSLLLDPSNQSFTFKATSAYLSLLNSLKSGNDSVVLPDSTYTVKLVSGTQGQGFVDALGAGLDGAGNGGSANFVTTFTTHYQANSTPVLAIPDFAPGLIPMRPSPCPIAARAYLSPFTTHATSPLSLFP